MFLLMLSRQTVPAMALATKEDWSIATMPALHRLRGQVCGLFGFGRIASLLARKVLQLGMKVVFYDAYLRESRMTGVDPCSFDMLLECSDFISLHVPLTKETRHRFAESTFIKMKSSASIINTARGELIDQAALLAALDSGQISGAALDVLDSTEVGSPLAWTLRDHPRIILTPHSAWLSEEARMTLQASAVEQVIAGLRGEKPYGIVNRI
jgi:D-3-phosphoglycerate dehydrogenase